MKVKLLVKRDGCAAGSVVDYGPEKAAELIGHGEAETYVAPPPQEPAPPKAAKAVDKEPAKAGSSVKED